MKDINGRFMKGNSISESHKSKLSQIMKGNKKGFKEGHIPWNKNVPCSKGTKLKLSLANKGKIAWNKGKVFSEKTRGKMSLAKIGHIPWNSGKAGTYSMKHSGQFKKGVKFTEEQRKEQLRRREKSSLEIKFEQIINKLGLPYKFVGNGDVFIGGKVPDFISTNNSKVAIEVFYRRHKEEFRGGFNDWMLERKKIFKENGWDILFFNETQVNLQYIDAIMKGGLKS